MRIHKFFSKLAALIDRSSLARLATVLAIGLVALGSFGAHALYRQIYPKITTATSTTLVAIPYSSSTVESDTLDRGTTSVQTKGVAGQRTQVWTTTYKNGVEMSKKLTSESVTKAPTNEVILKGTRVATVSQPTSSQSSAPPPLVSSTNSHASECKTKMVGAASIYTNGATSMQQSSVASIDRMVAQGISRGSIGSSYTQAEGSLSESWISYTSTLPMFTDSNYVACAPEIYAQQVYMPAESSLIP